MLGIWTKILTLYFFSRNVKIFHSNPVPDGFYLSILYNWTDSFVILCVGKEVLKEQKLYSADVSFHPEGCCNPFPRVAIFQNNPGNQRDKAKSVVNFFSLDQYFRCWKVGFFDEKKMLLNVHITLNFAVL